MSEPEQRYFFIHLMKTAGTSLRERLKEHFGVPGVYPNRTDGRDVFTQYLDLDNLRMRMRVRGDEVRVVCGHFPLCTQELLGGGFTTFTVLRHPLDRTLSYLRHHRQQTPADRHKSLEEIYADPFRFHGMAHNHMTKMFSLTPDEMTAGMLTEVEFTPERTEAAKAALATVDVVGVQEHFEAFCDELTRRFGWDLGEPRHVNDSEPSDVSDEFRERILADHAADLALYELALELAPKQRAGKHQTTTT